MSILKPMMMRRVPPNSSACRLRRLPNVAPNMLPHNESVNEVAVIIATGRRMFVRSFIPKQENVMPTAKASILVAIESAIMTMRRVGEREGLSLLVRCS